MIKKLKFSSYILISVFILFNLLTTQSFAMSFKDLFGEKMSSKKSLTGFDKPFGISIDKEGKLYISEFSKHKVLIYDKEFQLLNEISPGEEILDSPHSVDFDEDGNLYITDYKNKKVQKFSKEGEFLKTIIDDKYLEGPATSYFNNSGELLVSDYGSNSLMKFSKDGDFLGWIGAKSDGTFTSSWQKDINNRAESSQPAGFKRLHYALNDSHGDIYVADTWNHRIQKFTKDGKFIGWMGQREDEQLTNGWAKDGKAIPSKLLGGFNAPVAIHITKDDELYVFEYEGGRVQKFSKEGKLITPIAIGFNKGYDIKVNDKKLYVVDTGNKKIEIINLP